MGFPDRAHYASDGVRDRTQQLASMALEDSNSFRSGAPIPRRYAASDSDVTLASHIDSSPRDRSTNEPRQSSESYLRDDVIEEVSEPVSPEEENLIPAARDMPRGSLISHLIRTSPPKGSEDNIIRTEPEYNHARGRRDVPEVVVGDGALEADETAALLPKTHPADQDKKRQYGSTGEVDEYSGHGQSKWAGSQRALLRAKSRAATTLLAVTSRKSWDKRVIKRAALGQVKTLPAVFLGLLLNILDALSYGKQCLAAATASVFMLV